MGENQDPNLEEANLDPIPQKMKKNLRLFVPVQSPSLIQDPEVNPWFLNWILMGKMSKDRGRDLIQERAETPRRPTPAADLNQDKVKVNLQAGKSKRSLRVIF